MPVMLRVESVHTGSPGSPYLTTMYFRSVPGLVTQTLAERVMDFWTYVRNGMATPWSVNVNPEVALVDAATGVIGATTPVSTIGITAGGTSPEWTAKQGNLSLRTGQYRNGRRIQGRVYLPSVAGSQGEQEANATYRDRAEQGAQGLMGDVADLGSAWVVWSRPSTEGASDGEIADIQSVICRQTWAVLRSRRT